jgi:hypothetical protein
MHHGVKREREREKNEYKTRKSVVTEQIGGKNVYNKKQGNICKSF